MQKLQICRENPRPGQEKKYTSTNQHSPSCNREISFGISFESINVSQNYTLPDCIQIAYEMHWQNGLDC